MDEKKIIDFIYKYTRLDNFDFDENIFELGNINSLFVMQLVLFIEKEFDISVDNSIIGTEEFNSINSICGYVKIKLLSHKKTDNTLYSIGD